MQHRTRLYIGTISAATVLFPSLCQAQYASSSSSSTLPGTQPSFLTPATPGAATPLGPPGGASARPPGNPVISTKPPSAASAPAPAPVTRQAPPPRPKTKPAVEDRYENYYPEMPAKPTPIDSQDILNLIENQINAIQHHDLHKAYNLFTSMQFRQATSFDDFKYFVDSFPVFSKNKNAIFGNLDLTHNGIASLQGTLTSTDGQTLRVQYKFVKEGSQWKIIGIELFRPSYQPQIEEGPQPYDFQADVH